MSKGILTDSKVKVGTTEYAITGENYNVAYKEIDVTDTGTPGDGTEKECGRATRTFSFEAFIETGMPDIPLKVKSPIELDFDGKTYAGTGSFASMDNKATLDSGIVQSYAGSFDGEVTVTPKA